MNWSNLVWGWLALCRPFLDVPLAVQARLCRRKENHIKENHIKKLFVFVAEPEVPPDNAAAERSLRHLVVSRKVSGGTRSHQGTDTRMTLASIFGTWRAQGFNPLAACRQLLTSPSSLNSYVCFVGPCKNVDADHEDNW